MSDRQHNEEQYSKQQIVGDDFHNAAICSQIADNCLEWNPKEAVHWRKLAVENVEKHYGKNRIENTIYYDKLANDYFENGSFSQALKWNSKSRKIKIMQLGEYAHELLENELLELQLHYHMRQYDEIPSVREYIKILLEKNTDYEGAVLYNVYLILAKNKQWDGDLEYIDSAMRIAEKVYGEISMETADAYRIKALEIWYGAVNVEDKKEAVESNNRAYYIGTHAKDNGQGSQILGGIVRNMQAMKLEDENSYNRLLSAGEKVLHTDNAGISKQEDNDNEDELSPELEERLEELYEKGNQLEREEQYDEALQAWREGYALIPAGLRWDLEATNQFLAAMGDIYFLRKGMYQEAYECFDTARGYGGYDNPFIMLRLGESCLELGDELNAAEYLMRAWMMEGEEIFEPDEDGEDDGSKYYEFLRMHVDLTDLTSR